MNAYRLAGFVGALVFVSLGFTAAGAHAVTKYQTSLVPDVAGTTPGFSAKGSSIRINGHLVLKGKLKGVVDGSGDRITATNYSVEVDVTVPATAASETVTVSFNLKNGNGTFVKDLSTDPVLSAAGVGDGVAVTAVRVKDNASTVIGHGGFAIQ
jgi:hypothetical protein